MGKTATRTSEWESNTDCTHASPSDHMISHMLAIINDAGRSLVESYNNIGHSSHCISHLGSSLIGPFFTA